MSSPENLSCLPQKRELWVEGTNQTVDFSQTTFDAVLLNRPPG